MKTSLRESTQCSSFNSPDLELHSDRIMHWGRCSVMRTPENRNNRKGVHEKGKYKGYGFACDK